MLSLKSVGFSTSRLHTVHIVLSDNGCDKCICSLSRSESSVISVVKQSPVKIIYSKKTKKKKKYNKKSVWKSQKRHVCYQHIGKCLALVFCRTVFVSWWRVYLLASSCLNWCLVQHSSVRTQRHSLVCPFPNPPPVTHPHPSGVPLLVLAKDVYNVFIFLFYFFFLWEIQSSSSPSPTSISSVHVPFRSLCKVYITMVLFYTILCNLPL